MPGRRGPSQARVMSPIEAAWVGAIIEGEGCYGKSRSKSDTYTNYRVSVANTSIEIMSALLRATGDGKVYLRNPQTSTSIGKKDLYIWEISVINTVFDIAKQTCGYSEKAQHFIEVFV